MSGVSDDAGGWEDSDNPDELGSVEKLATMMKESRQASVSKSLEVATFAGGCFWCTEAVFDQLKGVVKVESGYSGGNVPNPSYEDVCTGETGHAESIQVPFAPSDVSYDDLLGIVLTNTHPTTPNRQ